MGAGMKRQAQLSRQSRLTDGAVLLIALLLATGLCAVMTLVEMVFLA